MIILGTETSCDETAVAVLEQKNGRIQILSNVVASSASLQAKYGGIIPEQAAREQIKSIVPVIEESLQVAGTRFQEIDAIAVTQGPGLIGSLLVGVETAKTLATVWNKPLIPVNHLIGHFYANFIKVSNTKFQVPKFPCIGLLVSGGHTDLVLFKDHNKYEYLGGTRDDAAGECFDKCARLLGLPYPGGPEISKLAAKGKDTFKLPRPMIESKDFDFSFSGLKTAVANLIKQSVILSPKGEGSLANASLSETSSEILCYAQNDRGVLSDLAASIEAAIVDVLVLKTVQAAKCYNVEQIMIAGGVAANQKLINDLRLMIKDSKLHIKLFVPSPVLCTDNGAMIAAAAFFSPRLRPAFVEIRQRRRVEAGQKPIKDPLKLQADPNLSLAY